MRITQRHEGEFIFGLVDFPIYSAAFKSEGAVLFYFKINTRLQILELIEEGKIEIGNNLVAEFEMKGREFSFKTRFADNISSLFPVIFDAKKELEEYFNISSIS